MDRVRWDERERKFDVRAWLTNPTSIFSLLLQTADAALCLTLIGCGTQDQMNIKVSEIKQLIFKHSLILEFQSLHRCYKVSRIERLRKTEM